MNSYAFLRVPVREACVRRLHLQVGWPDFCWFRAVENLFPDRSGVQDHLDFAERAS